MKEILIFDTIPVCGQPISHIHKKLVNDKSRFDDLEYPGPQSWGVLVSKDHYLLDNKKYEDIKDNITYVVEQYKTDVLGIKNDIVMTTSWMTLNKTGCSHGRHDHPGVFISLTHYLNCESGDLIFEFDKSPIAQNFNLHYDVEEFNIFNSPSWTFEVRTDDTIIFPGYVKHLTTPNYSKTNRLCLGANFFFKGQYGADLTLDKVVFN